MTEPYFKPRLCDNTNVADKSYKIAFFTDSYTCRIFNFVFLPIFGYLILTIKRNGFWRIL